MFELTAYDSNGDTIHALTQWDLNQVIYIDNVGFTSSPIAYFNDSCGKHSFVINTELVGNSIKIIIPNLLLQKFEPIIIGICIYVSQDNISRTKYFVKLPVRKREMPNDYVYVENTGEITLSSLQLKVNELESKIGNGSSLNGSLFFTGAVDEVFNASKDVTINIPKIDSSLSDTSENAVQNKLVTNELNKKAPKRYDVTITNNNGSYSSDKTFNEILSVNSSGGDVWFVYSGGYGKAYWFYDSDDLSTTAFVANMSCNTGSVSIKLTDKNVITVTQIEQSDTISYELSKATSTTLGGIKAYSATSDDTVQVKIRDDGFLVVPTYPTSNGSANTNATLTIRQGNGTNDEWISDTYDGSTAKSIEITPTNIGIGKINFTGAVTKTYTGLSDITINIPEGGTGSSTTVDSSITNILNYDVIVDDSSAATANTTAINSALQSLSDSGGGKMYFPIGTYHIDDTITIPYNVVIEGETKGAVLYMSTYKNVPAVYIENIEDKEGYPRPCGIKNITIRGSFNYGNSEHVSNMDNYKTILQQTIEYQSYPNREKTYTTHIGLKIGKDGYTPETQADYNGLYHSVFENLQIQEFAVGIAVELGVWVIAPHHIRIDDCGYGMITRSTDNDFDHFQICRSFRDGLYVCSGGNCTFSNFFIERSGKGLLFGSESENYSANGRYEPNYYGLNVRGGIAKYSKIHIMESMGHGVYIQACENTNFEGVWSSSAGYIRKWESDKNGSISDTVRSFISDSNVKFNGVIFCNPIQSIGTFHIDDHKNGCTDQAYKFIPYGTTGNIGQDSSFIVTQRLDASALESTFTNAGPNVIVLSPADIYKIFTGSSNNGGSSSGGSEGSGDTGDSGDSGSLTDDTTFTVTYFEKASTQYLCIGDSITEKAVVIPALRNKFYYLSEYPNKIGWCGYGGQTTAGIYSNITNNVTSSQNSNYNDYIGKANIITYESGINDWLNNVSLDGYEIWLTKMYTKIRTDNPNALLIFFTPHYCYELNLGISGQNSSGFTVLDYADRMKSFCSARNILCVDCTTAWDSSNYATYLDAETDGYKHPNNTGADVLATLIADALTKKYDELFNGSSSGGGDEGTDVTDFGTLIDSLVTGTDYLTDWDATGICWSASSSKYTVPSGETQTVGKNYPFSDGSITPLNDYSCNEGDIITITYTDGSSDGSMKAMFGCFYDSSENVVSTANDTIYVMGDTSKTVKANPIILLYDNATGFLNGGLTDKSISFVAPSNASKFRFSMSAQAAITVSEIANYISNVKVYSTNSNCQAVSR